MGFVYEYSTLLTRSKKQQNFDLPKFNQSTLFQRVLLDLCYTGCGEAWKIYTLLLIVRLNIRTGYFKENAVHVLCTLRL